MHITTYVRFDAQESSVELCPFLAAEDPRQRSVAETILGLHLPGKNGERAPTFSLIAKTKFRWVGFFHWS